MIPLAHSAVLKNYMRVTEQLNINPYHLLSSVGLSPTQLSNNKQRISVDKAIALLEKSARNSGCEAFGLKMAEQRQLSDFGEVSLLLNYQHTLRDAIQTIVRYQNFLNNSLAIYIEEEGNTAIIRQEVIGTTTTYSRQAIELALGIMHRFCESLLQQKWKPLSVHFTHNAPQDLTLHRKIFGCPLEFGSDFNGIVCTSADLNSANPLANNVMANYAQSYLNIIQNNHEASFIFDIRKSIHLLLPMGRATIDQVAHTHGLTVRTLQRRLEAADTSFSILINDVRKVMVFRYLTNLNYSLGQVSDILGYSMPSSFTRWFISQFKVSPTIWRNNHKQSIH